MSKNKELTDLHVAVLKCAARGLTSRQAADELAGCFGDAEPWDTERRMRKEIFDRLGATNITHAVALGLLNGIISFADIGLTNEDQSVGTAENSARQTHGNAVVVDPSCD